MKILIIGLGNPILTDDAAGILVAQEIKKHLAASTEQAASLKEIEVMEASLVGIIITALAAVSAFVIFVVQKRKAAAGRVQ